MTDLVLFRHAKAASSDDYAADEHRPLTPDGRRAALNMGRALAANGVAFGRMVSSPLVRAVETAVLAGQVAGYEGALAVVPELEPAGRAEHILRALRNWVPAKGALVAIGHEPSIGRVVSLLLGHPELSLGKGTAVRLRWSPGAVRAELEWVMSAKQLEPSRSLELLGG